MKLVTGLFTILILLGCSRTAYLEYRMEHPLVPFRFQSKELKISKFEINNLQFRRFIDATKNYHFQSDSTGWASLSDQHKANKLGQTYHKHPAYNLYPVVNITYEAALGYCEWLTSQLKQERANSQVIVRLPTSSEMESLLSEKFNSKASSYHEDYACNFTENLKYKNPDGSENLNVDGGAYALYGNAYQQKGLNHIIGNVSEICEGNIIKGGNWDTFPKEVKKTKHYVLPDPRVGFRIVIERKPSQ